MLQTIQKTLNVTKFINLKFFGREMNFCVALRTLKVEKMMVFAIVVILVLKHIKEMLKFAIPQQTFSSKIRFIKKVQK
jgi:hypothetical protein